MDLKSRWVKAGPVQDNYPHPAPTCNTPPTAADMQAQGYLWYDQLSDLPAAQEGYGIENVRFVDAGSGRAALQWDTYSVQERAAQQAAEAQTAEQNRLSGLCAAYGGLVTALSAALGMVGHSIPCEAATVTADLIQRELAGALNQTQHNAKSTIAALYLMMHGQGVSDDDIAVIWQAVRP